MSAANQTAVHMIIMRAGRMTLPCLLSRDRAQQGAGGRARDHVAQPRLIGYDRSPSPRRAANCATAETPSD